MDRIFQCSNNTMKEIVRICLTYLKTLRWLLLMSGNSNNFILTIPSTRYKFISLQSTTSIQRDLHHLAPNVQNLENAIANQLLLQCTLLPWPGPEFRPSAPVPVEHPRRDTSRNQCLEQGRLRLSITRHLLQNVGLFVRFEKALLLSQFLQLVRPEGFVGSLFSYGHDRVFCIVRVSVLIKGHAIVEPIATGHPFRSHSVPHEGIQRNWAFLFYRHHDRSASGHVKENWLPAREYVQPVAVVAIAVAQFDRCCGILPRGKVNQHVNQLIANGFAIVRDENARGQQAFRGKILPYLVVPAVAARHVHPEVKHVHRPQVRQGPVRVTAGIEDGRVEVGGAVRTNRWDER
uniref:(northern house mosquito) hypothetical protein n=2 Tax=Culex pipiens TaxID=7175 RepID=A0A8D8AHF6_CULPI